MKDFNEMSLEELRVKRAQMAKTANANIRSIEKYGHRSAKDVIVDPYLKRQGKRRFSESKKGLPVNQYTSTPQGRRKATESELINRERRKIISELGVLQKFSEAETHTLRGVKQNEKNRRQAFAEATGLKMPDRELKTLMEADAFGWVKHTLGSPVIQAIARAVDDKRLNLTSEEMSRRIEAIIEKFESLPEKSQTPERLFKEINVPNYRYYSDEDEDLIDV